MTPRPTLARRLALRFALTFLALIGLLGVLLDQTIVSDRLRSLRTVVATGAVLTGGAAILTAWLIARRVTRQLRRMTDSVERMAAGDTGVRIAPGETAEIDLLASTLNRMAQELGARIDQMADDRRTRDLILSTMEESVALIEADDRLGYQNPAARRTLGDAETLSAVSPHAIRRLVAAARSGGGPVEEEIETGPPVRTLRVSAVPVGARVLVVMRDITRARRVEAMRRDFVANASHELKTPVASIQAVAETLRTAIRENPEAAADFAERLERETVRLSRLVTDLLDLSRVESERLPADPVRLDRVAAAGATPAAERARVAGLELRTDFVPCTVLGSAKDLAVLITNLLDNAVRFTPEGGRVEMSVRPAGGTAIIEVRDTGIGIPRRDLPRIFERFYRVDPARSRQTGGTGLGLAIAKHVAEEHGGRIEAESELGQGSTFRVTLPLHDPK